MIELFFKFAMSSINYFHYRENDLFIENVNLKDVCHQYETPCYVYSANAIETNLHKLKNAVTPIDANLLICFAVKSNSNLSIIKLLNDLGCGMDCVSIGEIQRCFKVNVNPQKIVFSGVGKTKEEMLFAVENNIMQINVESEEELYELSEIAKSVNKIANVALRVNTKTDACTHKYLSTDRKCDKFGIDINRVISLCTKFAQTKQSCLNIVGLSCHVGSQITSLDVYENAFSVIADLAEKLLDLGINLKCLDFGGGIGVSYKPDDPGDSLINLTEYGKLLKKMIKPFSKLNIKLIIEPGRFLVANSGCLLSKVVRIKRRDNAEKKILIIDAGMNDLIRPCLYRAYHHIIPLRLENNGVENSYDIVGPVCESADVFCVDMQMRQIMNAGDYVAILNAGAYGSSMSSRYNSRPLIAEVLIKGSEMFLIRERETLEAVLNFERVV